MLNKTLRVFVVDDDDLVRQSIVGFLQLNGHEVFEFGSPGVAIVQISHFLLLKKRLDLVISDLTMPNTSGELVLWHAKKISNGEIGTILISGNSEEEIKEAALKAKADAFLIKPFYRDDLLKTIDGIFPELTVG